MKIKISTDHIALSLFFFSIILIAVSYGIAAEKFKLFPYSIVSPGIDQLNMQQARPHYLGPIRYSDSGAKIHDAKSMAPGVTLITTYWPNPGTDWQPAVHIIDVAGNILHQWTVSSTKIWPVSPYGKSDDQLKTTGNNYVHGSHLFPNGDVLINFEYYGLVRLNACNKEIWKLPYRTHHSVSLDKEDGNFWISGINWVEDGSGRAAEFAGLRTPFGEDTLLKVSPEGKVIKEISILRALYDSGYQHLLWTTSRKGDITHLNDVETLNTNLATPNSLFDAGDIVVSLRNINTIAVLDQSGKIKWLNAKDFTGQHDPDFERDGWITVFNNRHDDTHTGKYLGGSTITAINPVSGKMRQVYPTNNTQEFYSSLGGKHQQLENGNRLITEARAGRVFEIDASGRTVWEWIHQSYNEKLVPEVLEATRYSISAETVAGWSCS